MFVGIRGFGYSDEWAVRFRVGGSGACLQRTDDWRGHAQADSLVRANARIDILECTLAKVRQRQNVNSAGRPAGVCLCAVRCMAQTNVRVAAARVRVC